jgi:hypothetical protein
MISFLIEEGALSFGAMTGLFTATLLNSLKSNIVDPLCENIIDSRKLDKHAKSQFGDDNCTLPNNTPCVYIKWQTFIRDFISWLIIISMLYLFWKNCFHPYKVNLNTSPK